MRIRLLAPAAALAMLAVACGAASDPTPDEAAVVEDDGPVVGEEAGAPVDIEALKAEADAVPLAETDAAPPPVLPARPGGASGYSRYVFRGSEGAVLTSLVEGPLGRQTRCQDVELPCSYEDLKELVASGDEPPAELDMTTTEVAQLVDELDATRAVVDRYADVRDACADGYVSDRTQTPNMGTHFWKAENIADGEFDPAEPEIIIYAAAGGIEPTREILGQCVDGEWTGGDLEVVAASYILPHPATDDRHPEGYTGDLDNWHIHYNLCRGGGVDTIVPREECEARGGSFSPTLGWMLHAWVAPGFDNQLGVFSMWNPTIWPVADPDSLHQRWTSRPEGEGEGIVSTIESFAFERLEVEAGESVVWYNADAVPHTVTEEGSAEFDSGVFAPGEEAEITFDEPGEYEFFCALHPDMQGTVVVR